jgi:hypothetical protein
VDHFYFTIEANQIDREEPRLVLLFLDKVGETAD